MGSLRTRLLLAYAGLILVGFGGLAVFAGGQISSTTVEDFRNRLLDQARLLARALREPVGHLGEGESSLASVVALLDNYEVQTAANLPGATIALLDGRGRVWLGDAAASEPDAPEIRAAMRGDVIVDTRRDADGLTTVYTAAPIGEDGRLVGMVWLFAPLSTAQSLVQKRWLALGGGVLALTAAAALASLWLSVSLSRPLLQLRQSALGIARGDFAQRLPADREDEIGELARAFNHMAAQVGT